MSCTISKKLKICFGIYISQFSETVNNFEIWKRLWNYLLNTQSGIVKCLSIFYDDPWLKIPVNFEPFLNSFLQKLCYILENWNFMDFTPSNQVPRPFWKQQRNYPRNINFNIGRSNISKMLTWLNAIRKLILQKCQSIMRRLNTFQSKAIGFVNSIQLSFSQHDKLIVSIFRLFKQTPF